MWQFYSYCDIINIFKAKITKENYNATNIW